MIQASPARLRVRQLYFAEDCSGIQGFTRTLARAATMAKVLFINCYRASPARLRVRQLDVGVDVDGVRGFTRTLARAATAKTRANRQLCNLFFYRLLCLFRLATQKTALKPFVHLTFQRTL